MHLTNGESQHPPALLYPMLFHTAKWLMYVTEIRIHFAKTLQRKWTFCWIKNKSMGQRFQDILTGCVTFQQLHCSVLFSIDPGSIFFTSTYTWIYSCLINCLTSTLLYHYYFSLMDWHCYLQLINENQKHLISLCSSRFQYCTTGISVSLC